MGKTAIKISQVNNQELLKDLNRAYCDEWLAHYAYWYMAQIVTGMGYEDMAEFLEKTAKDEAEHAEEIATRILELGGRPTSNPSELEKNANAPYPLPPKTSSDYRKIIEVVLEAEKGAIEVYNKIAAKTLGKDHVTYQLAAHILSEEVMHEERFEGLKS